jgi:hypothetical protein
MTNVALLALTVTLAAETAASPEPASPAPAVPASAEAAPSPAAATAPSLPALAKPPESDIEVLTEVVDLEEAEDPTAAWYGQSYPTPVRHLSLLTARPAEAGDGEFMVEHRSATPLYNNNSDSPWGDMWHNFLGLDQGIQVGLGLRYGVIENLDVGVYRAGSSATDTYELDARYRVVGQDKLGLDVAARAGVTWFVQPHAADAHGFFGQLLGSRLFANRLLATGAVLFHSNSTNGTKYNEDKAWSLAGALAIEWRIAAPVALDVEGVFCTAGYCSKRPAFTAGAKYITTRHSFALVCTNTTWVTADGYITNTDRAWDQLGIGFNITRSY